MKVTIVIPTRERAATLYATLQTCLMQDYRPLEILVSDNCSQDDTRQVVESFSDPRIRYLNTGKRVSMTANWEFALSHVREGFVTFIGDDDGFLPNGIANAMAIIRQFSLSALAWKKVEYTWPSYSIPGMRNLLIIPQMNLLLRMSGKKVIRDCALFLLGYNFCPCVYNSLVDFSCLARVKTKTGRFLHSVIPDVYSGFAMASEANAYFYSTRPFSVNGASGRSNGTNYKDYFKNRKDPNNPTVQFFQENDLPMHPRMPVLIAGCNTTAVLEAILQANDRCYSGTLKIDFCMAIRRAFMEIAPLEAMNYQEAVRQLRAIYHENPYRDFVETCAQRYPNHPTPDPAQIIGQRNAFEEVMDVTNEPVRNVREASEYVLSRLPEKGIPQVIHDYSRFFLLFFTLGPKIARKLPNLLQGVLSRALNASQA